MSQENFSNSTPKPYPEADSSEQIGKVAETVSTAYAARADAKWKPPARTIAGLAADEEVWSFVKANDLLPHLETAIQLARKTFLNVREMWLAYLPDPELPKFNSVGIWVKAVGTPEELFEQYKKYVSLFTHDVPSEYRHQIGMLVGVT
jgi:hypothetical protein